MKYVIDSLRKEQAYHHTALMVLFKAIDEIYGPNPVVRNGNSLNQGFFIYLNDTSAELSNNEVDRIREHMERIVAEDMPVNIIKMTNREAAELWRIYRYPEKAALFEQQDPDGAAEICEIGGLKNCFYSDMLESTGLLELYDLRSYRRGMLLRVPTFLSPDSIPPYRDDDRLYDTFADSKRMRKALGIDWLADLNSAIVEGKADEIIELSETLQNSEIEDIAKNIADEGRRIVLIAGPSSSGKTTFAKKLCKGIEDATSEPPLYLGTDDYFKERKDNPIGPDGEPDYECFEALDFELFNEQMEALLSGREADIPEYDFIEGTKTFGKRKTKLKKGQVLVIEGIHSFNDELTRDIDANLKYKVYISPLTMVGIDRHNRLSTTDARMLRRMVRDNNFRGTGAAGTIHSWPKVRAGESVNIFPYSSKADYVFNSSLNYETALLKSYAKPLLEAITSDQPEYDEARRMLEFLECFVPIEDASHVPADSLLREFIGPAK